MYSVLSIVFSLLKEKLRIPYGNAEPKTTHKRTGTPMRAEDNGSPPSPVTGLRRSLLLG